MNVDTRTAGIALAKRESMTLNDANVKITCRHGCLWLTERCGSEDIGCMGPVATRPSRLVISTP
mgnify:CR=1 FL=1